MADQKKVGVFGPLSEEIEESTAMLVQANNSFGFNLHQNLIKDGGNVFFSPFSVSTAFAMLFRGASGETAEELRETLGYKITELDAEDIHQNFHKLIEICNQNNEHALCIANAILTHDQFSILEDYKNDVQSLYQASVREVDFANDSSALSEVNQWVKEKTRNNIEKLFESISPDTVMILLSAVYFKGSWSTMFDPKNTKLNNFYNGGSEDNIKNIPMMYLKGKFRYFQNEIYQAVELPYQGETMSMLVVLPLKSDGLLELENGVCSRVVQIPKYLFRRFEVSLTMPKFDMAYSKNLNGVLKDLGLSTLFSADAAEFEHLTSSVNVFVSQVEHKAVLRVNEEGTEAAAVTGVVLAKRSLPISVTFTADHPFLFFILDVKRDLILFMGRVEHL